MPGNYFILEAEIGLSVSFMCYLPIKSKTVVTPDALSLYLYTGCKRQVCCPPH